MGYIDDKAKEADYTIKGVGAVVIIVIALCCLTGSINGGIIAFLVILGLISVGLIIWAVYKHSLKKEQEKEAALARQREAARAAKARQDEFELGKKQYYVRLQELGFEKKDQPIVYEKYNNCDSYYKVYVWKENDKIWTVLTEPDENSYWEHPKYKDLSNLKKLYTDISTINYVDIEKNLCVVYSNWKPIYYRKDALATFAKLIPEKIKNKDNTTSSTISNPSAITQNIDPISSKTPDLSPVSQHAETVSPVLPSSHEIAMTRLTISFAYEYLIMNILF